MMCAFSDVLLFRSIEKAIAMLKNLSTIRRIGGACALLLGMCHANAAETVNVLYAGSLVHAMEQRIGPAFEKESGLKFQGFAGGSNLLANQIKGRLRRADVYISASPSGDLQLMDEANGKWVSWYVNFAESPMLIGYNPKSRFAAALKTERWDQALTQSGIRLGRTDPKLDPKGLFVVQLLQKAQEVYHEPDLSQRMLGGPENPAQVMPEETLVGWLQSGQLDAGFFYSTETSDLKIPSIELPSQFDIKAAYTITIPNRAPNEAGAERFVAFLLSDEGHKLLQESGINVIQPGVEGDSSAVPAPLEQILARPVNAQ